MFETIEYDDIDDDDYVPDSDIDELDEIDDNLENFNFENYE